MDNLLHPQGGHPKFGACFQESVLDKDLGHFCLACASQGPTCCQGHDIYVTRGDCERIGRNSRTADFFEYRGCCHEDYADQSDDPVWQQYVFRRDGSRRVLKRRPDGDCLFLSPTGCTLLLTTRPLVCRLYPHLYSASGITGAWDGACLAAKTQAHSIIESGIAGVQWQEAIRWHRMLYTEIFLEANSNENRLDL